MTEIALTAAEWARMMRQPVRDHGYQLTRLGASVADYLAWKQLSGAADRTLDQYERDLARISLLHPDTPIEGWTSEMCLQGLRVFPEKSRRRARAAMNDLFKWALLWGKTTSNPVDRIPHSKAAGKPDVETFSPQEIKHLTGTVRDQRDRVLTMILLQTGVRKGEARMMRVGDWDFDRLEVRIPQGKGSKRRTIPVGTRLAMMVAELATLDGLRPDDHLWYSRPTNRHGRTIRRDRPVGEGTFHRWWERMIDEAEVPYRNPHTTRHTYATEYLRAGGDIYTLADNLGHASVAVTHKTYAHLTTQDRRRDLERVLAVWEQE